MDDKVQLRARIEFDCIVYNKSSKIKDRQLIWGEDFVYKKHFDLFQFRKNKTIS